ncbi:hypothetical protein SCLCIDRAFT_421699 [Scleroderma citrinum Foug A]|uniref:Uncharacterized protein n=1 Tax=Scleroderma citrinum Foug A TaxID=1036808 RepID=A0A0C3DZA4_9AGAM|nr:hypothetical protein SCLCIDRAFT_421699 [Scleroderma citrinum Foug A]
MTKWHWPADTRQPSVRDCLEPTLHIIFIMSVPCNPSPGTYNIFASDGSSVNTCP